MSSQGITVSSTSTSTSLSDAGTVLLDPVRGERSPFEAHFSELLEYKRRHGDCNDPKKYDANPSLGAWCDELRISYKQS